MITRFLTLLVALAATVFGSGGIQAQIVTWTGEAPAKGSFYIFSNSNVYLSPNTGTTFCVTKSSIQDAPLLTLGNNTSPYTITENGKSLGCTVTKSGSNYSAALNTTETRASKKNWTFTGVTGGYRISNVGTANNANGNYNRTNYLQYSGGKLNPNETANNAAVWTLVSQGQYNAFNPSTLKDAVGATSASWGSNISTSKESVGWMAKSNAATDGEYVKLNLGVANGYYLVTIVAKKTGSAQAAIVASSGTNVNSTYVTTDVSTYELPVKVTDGNISVFVRSYGNAGDVYAMVTKVLAITESVFNSKNIGPWIPEAPAAKEYFIFHPYSNKFLTAPSTVSGDINSSKLFTLSAATDATISYDDNGTTKYVYESAGNQSWGTTNTNKWTIASNNGGYYISHTDPANTRYTRYVNYNGSGIDYPRQNFVDDYRTWQFISNSQYSAIYPTNYVRGLLKNNTVNVERSGVSLIFPEKDGETWLAKTAASTSGEYLTLNFTGLSDGYYQVDVDVKKSGSGNATINAKGATTASKNIGTTLSTQTLSVQVTGGKLSVYVNAADKNCGNVYAAIKNIKEIVVIPDNSVFYFYNKGGQAYMEAGLDFGTTATIGSGIAFTIKQKDVANGKYTIKTQIGGSDNLGLDESLNGPFVDISTTMTTDVIIEAVPGQANTYTLKYEIAAGAKYVSATQGNNRVGTVVAANDDYAYWVFKTFDERKAELTNATNANGVDATFLLKDPNFGRDDKRISSWNGVTVGSNMENGGPQDNFNLSINNKVFDIYQEVTGLPNGLYVVTMQGIRNSDSNDAELYVNEYSRTLKYVSGVNTSTDAYNQFKTGACVASLPVKVTDGKLKVGVRSSVSTGNVYVDNFTITYYGAIGKFTALPDNLIPNPGFQLNTDHTWNASWSKGTGDDNKTVFAMQVYDTKDEYFDVNKGAYAEMRGINSQVAAGDINQTKTLDPGFYTLTADVTAINREGVLYASVKNDKVYSVTHNGDRKTVSLTFYVANRVNVTVGYKHEAKTSSDVCIMAVDNFVFTKMAEPATADINPASMISPWVEVTSASHDALTNPSKYFFAIWADNSKLLALGNGTAGHQGAGYKTMTYKSVTDPISDLANLWEFYKSNGKYVIASASDREHILQTSDGGNYLRYQAATPVDVASGEFQVSFADTKNNCRFISDNGGICQWDGANEVAIKGGFSHYKLYAISRVDYYRQTQKLEYNATTLTPIDVSLLVANPEGLGTSGDVNAVLGWTNTKSSLYASGDGRYAEKNGNLYFGYYSDDTTVQPTGTMTQTISGLPKGYYVLSVKTDDAQSGAELFMGDLNESFTSAVDKTVSVSGAVESNGGSLTLGVKLNNYQPYVDGDDQPYKYQLNFDKFELKYYGTDEVLAEQVGEGEYYIRTNVGTDANPEYRYLEAGGNSTWGTEPVIGDHGFAYKLEKNGTKAGGVQLYALNSFIKEKTASQYFNGYYNDRNKDRSLISFIPVDAVNKPLDYRIYTERNVISDGTVCNAGYLYPKSDTELGVKADNSGATVWQVVNELQRIKEMANASMSNPVDATFFIKDPDFSRNDTRSGYWKVGNNAADTLKHTNDTQYAADYSTTVGGVKFVKGNNGQNNTNFNVRIQATRGEFNMRQKIQSVNLPTGIYRISAQGAVGTNGNVTLYAADGDGKELGSVAFDVHQFGSNEAAAAEFNKGTYKKTIEVHVLGNGLTIGFRGTTQTATSYVDNVEMYYLGEKPMDLAEITESVDVYMYNVEAGQFLADNSTYAVVSNTGKLWTVDPKRNDAGDVEPGLFAIRRGASYLVPSSSTGTAIGYQTLVNGTSPYYWTMTENSGFMVIKDAKGRILEWNGDKAANVLSGTANDVEPRGTRWQFYTASQYGKDRSYANNASNARMANWPIVRAAKVNMKHFTGAYAIEGLESSYNALDAIWSNPQSSTAKINAVSEELKSKMMAAVNAKKGSMKVPVDISFMIKNANLGDRTDNWNTDGTWSTKSADRATTIYPNKTNIIGIGQFLYGQVKSGASPLSLSQEVSGLPAGTYKVGLDIRSRNVSGYPSGGQYRLSATTPAGNCGEIGNDSPESFKTIKNVRTLYVNIFPEEVLSGNNRLTVKFENIAGSVAFDNFTLLYCGGNVADGSFQLSDDESELTLTGAWDVTSNPELKSKLMTEINNDKATVTSVVVDSDNGQFSGNVNFDEILPDGYNIFVYTNVDGFTGTKNIVDVVTSIDKDEEEVKTYKAKNIVLTDGKQVKVPQEFKADKVSYSRTVSIPSGYDFQWSTIVLPFDVTKRPAGVIDFYLPTRVVDKADGSSTLRVNQINNSGTLTHNTPVIVKQSAALNITETNATVYRTDELEKPRVDVDGMTVFGNYSTKYVVGGDTEKGNNKANPDNSIPNDDGLYANCGLYVKSNQFLRGNGWFNIGPFRAFIYDPELNIGTISSARMKFDIEDLWDDEDELADGLEIADADEITVEGYYSVNGVRLDAPQKGINIVRFTNGSSRKIYVK